MSDQVERLSDDAIEQSLARRAPHGPDAALLESIVFAAAATPQLRSRRPVSSLPARVHVHLAWIAVVMALLLAIATRSSGRIPSARRPAATVVTISPTRAHVTDSQPASLGKRNASASGVAVTRSRKRRAMETAGVG